MARYSAAPALRKALQDRDAELCKAAAYALKQIEKIKKKVSVR
jgi:hypothetical protein